MACIRLFEGIKYVLPILHPNKKRLALIMCPEEDSASVEWARQKDENWVNKDITSLEFVENIFRLMNWNRECRYKVLGRVANGQIYAEKFTSACLICKVFYGKMKAQ